VHKKFHKVTHADGSRVCIAIIRNVILCVCLRTIKPLKVKSPNLVQAPPMNIIGQNQGYMDRDMVRVSYKLNSISYLQLAPKFSLRMLNQ